MNEIPQRPIAVLLTPKLWAVLELLLEEQGHGCTLEEVAERCLCTELNSYRGRMLPRDQVEVRAKVIEGRWARDTKRK